MAELSVNAVLAVVVREMPGASVVAFDDRAEVVAMAGPDAEELRERSRPKFERVLEDGERSVDDWPGEDAGRRRIDVAPVRDANGRVVGGVCLARHVSDVDLLREELD